MEFLSVNIAIEKNALDAQEILERLRARLNSLDSDASEFLAPRLWSLDDGLETFYNEVDNLRYDISNGRVKGRAYETRRLRRIDDKQGSALFLVVNFDALKSASDRKKLIESVAKLKTRFAGVVLFALSDETLEFQDDSFPRRLSYDFSQLFDETWIRVVVASCRTRSDGNYANVEEEKEIVVDAIAEEIVVNEPNSVGQGLFRSNPADNFCFEILGGRMLVRNDEELAKALAPRCVGDALEKIALQSKEASNAKYKTLEDAPSQTLRQIFVQTREIEIGYSGEDVDESIDGIVFSKTPSATPSLQSAEVDEILPTLKRVRASYANICANAASKASAQIERRVKLEASLWRDRFLKALASKEALQDLETYAQKSVRRRFRAESTSEEPTEPDVAELESLIADVPDVWVKILPVLLPGLFIFIAAPLIPFLVKGVFSFVALGLGVLALLVSSCVSYAIYGKRQGNNDEIVDKAKEKTAAFREYYQQILRKTLREKFAEAEKNLTLIVKEYARLLNPVAEKLASFGACQLAIRPSANLKKALDENRYAEFLTWLKTDQSKAFDENAKATSNIIATESSQGLELKKVDAEQIASKIMQTTERRLLMLVKSYGLDVFLRKPFDNPQSGVDEFCRVLAPNDKVFASGALIDQALKESAQNGNSHFFKSSLIYASSPKPDTSARQDSQISVRESAFPNVCVSVQTLMLFFGELSNEERQKIEETIRDETTEEEQTEKENKQNSEADLEENVPDDASTVDELSLDEETPKSLLIKLE